MRPDPRAAPAWRRIASAAGSRPGPGRRAGGGGTGSTTRQGQRAPAHPCQIRDDADPALDRVPCQGRGISPIRPRMRMRTK